MKLLVYGLLILLVGLGALRLLSRKLLYFPQPLAPGRRAELERLGPGVRPLEIRAGDKTLLQGWCLEKDVDTLPFIFYFGGNAEEVSLNIEDFWERVPANVVLLNYRGYGSSGGRPTEAAIKADSLAVYDAMARAYELKPASCLAWGRSLGSSPGAWLASRRGLGGLILTCPFDSIGKVAAGFYPGWLVEMVLPDLHNTTEFSGHIQARTLILAAENDEIIPFERTKALYESLTCPKNLVKIKGVGHNTVSEGEGYDAAVADLVESIRAGMDGGSGGREK